MLNLNEIPSHLQLPSGVTHSTDICCCAKIYEQMSLVYCERKCVIAFLPGLMKYSLLYGGNHWPFWISQCWPPSLTGPVELNFKLILWCHAAGDSAKYRMWAGWGLAPRCRRRIITPHAAVRGGLIRHRRGASRPV